MLDYEEFRDLPHAVTLLGMSGVGKTVLSTSLRRSMSWFHYSADYRIGTTYLAEHILDNIKFKIMSMGDRFVADLLRSDSIYINHNISVDNLVPVSTFLGMYGDAGSGGLDKTTFLERQKLYWQAEIGSMKDVSRFISKSWQIYRCKDFINDASGSLCEICDPNDQDDPIMTGLAADTLILYLRAGDAYAEKLIKRAQSAPKPLFYNPEFIGPYLKDNPDSGAGIDPLAFARPLLPELVKFRTPRYSAIAKTFGFTIDAEELFDRSYGEQAAPLSDRFLTKLFNTVVRQAEQAQAAADNLARYVESCRKRHCERIGV